MRNRLGNTKPMAGMDYHTVFKSSSSEKAAVPKLAPGWSERTELVAPAGLCMPSTRPCRVEPKAHHYCFAFLFFPPLSVFQPIWGHHTLQHSDGRALEVILSSRF